MLTLIPDMDNEHDSISVREFGDRVEIEIVYEGRECDPENSKITLNKEGLKTLISVLRAANEKIDE